MSEKQTVFGAYRKGGIALNGEKKQQLVDTVTQDQEKQP